MTEERVRELLFLIWRDQACRIPAHWQDVKWRLLRRRNDGYDDGARLDAACTKLAQAFSAEQPPRDPTMVVWQAWPKLTRDNCHRLATLLIDAGKSELASQQPKTIEVVA
jgi:hypothetical protein